MAMLPWFLGSEVRQQNSPDFSDYYRLGNPEAIAQSTRKGVAQRPCGATATLYVRLHHNLFLIGNYRGKCCRPSPQL